jgi:hypothetical protein
LDRPEGHAFNFWPAILPRRPSSCWDAISHWPGMDS